MSVLLRGLIATRNTLSSIILSLILPNLVLAGPETAHAPAPQVREGVGAFPAYPVPMLEYLIRPIGGGGGPFPLVVMNHGVSLDTMQPSYFPATEFRDAALSF